MIDVLLRNQNAILVRPAEDLRMENAHEFLEEFMGMSELTGKDIFLDFSRVQFVDSSGIGTLIKLAEIAKRGPGSLSLVGLNRALISVFRLSGLMQVFRVMNAVDLGAYFAAEDLGRFF